MSPIERKKETVPAGEMLVVQGRIPKELIYLHSGSVEILGATKEFEGLDPSIIASKSKRVGLISGETIIPPMNVAFNSASAKSVRTVVESQITRYQAKGGLEGLIEEDSNLALAMLTHLFRHLEKAVAEDSRYTKFYTYLCKINDNISLISQALPKSSLPDKLKNKSESLYSLFNSNKGEFAEIIDAQFLISDNSAFFKKKYSYPGLPIQSIVDQKQCLHVKKFLQLDKNVFLGLVKEDPSILHNMIETISDNLLKVLGRTFAVNTEIDLELETLFGAKLSWSSYLTDSGGFDRWRSSGNLSPNFINNFLSLIKKLHAYYLEISGKKLIDVFPGPKKIHEYYVSAKDRVIAPDEADKHSIKDKIKSVFHKGHAGGIYKNSMHQIFEFALVDKEFQKTFAKAINEFKNMSDPFNTEIEGRKIRRSITKYYFDLFTQVFIRKQKESSAPRPVNLMMKFGYLDETLLDQEQIDDLDQLLDMNEEMKDIPVLYEEEFLKKIYTGQEHPSISEMGLSYEAFRREEEKHKSTKDIKTSNAAGDNINKTIYEIQHRLLQTAGVCSGSTATAFPILTSMTMKIRPKNIVVTKDKINKIIRDLMSIDYSVFYREATLKLGGEARELIQEEVIPYFILIPVFGAKTMLWQDLDGTNRRTRGRIVVPVFFMGDLNKSMAHTFACFRWELNRTIKGGLWADPVEGGVTGVYFDYINFYKKNSKLTTEVRDKITERFKSLRTNRDRFADDYIQWVLYEKDGVMRLNSVVREMFYRHIPFKKEIRAKLENMPAFAELAVKFKNVNSKLIQGFERRFKKYMEKEGVYPEKIQEFMDFLNS